MGLFKQFKSDHTLENEGRWFDVQTPNEDGSVPGFKMRRTGTRNITWQKAIERIQRDNKFELDAGTMAPDEALSALIEAFVDTSLVEWRNVFGENEVVIPYSRANAIGLFTELPDLFTILRNRAAALVSYQDKSVEATGKN